MKITLCLSLSFCDQMLEVKKELLSLGHEVKMPPLEVADENGKMILVADYYFLRKSVTNDESWIWERKREAMINHFEKIRWSDGILVLNYDKNGMKNYIGANTFLEMGIAFNLDKPIYLLNDIPDMDFKEEILGMRPIILSGDFNKLNDIYE